MTRRLFYISLGATAGVLLFRKASQTAQKMTPAGLATGLADAIREFGAEVRAGMAEREAELREGLGLDEV